jgi:NAD(P)-dependent dehydrogenase (short-subunit alcohol dehydrogenase family)
MGKTAQGRLAGRRLLVTGAGSGIGKATAELFAREGARMALLDFNADSVGKVAAALEAEPFVLDVADEEKVRRTVSEAAERLGGLDGLANVAGMAIPAPLPQTTLADWNRVIAVNLTGPFLICREARPYLEDNERATIVNVSSGSALLPISLAIGSYVASKAGLIGFSKALAYELAPKIRVNVVCPGAVDTPILPDVVRDSANDPERSPYALKRVATPEEIAEAVLFLTSHESSYVTGTTFAVDGGRTFH